MTKTLFMFPGPGAQSIGMGKDLIDKHPPLKESFQQANDLLGFDLADLCFNGPADQLNSTVYSQPAIFVTSVICLKALREGLMGESLSGVAPDACAGLSLGEYTALYAAGTMDFEQALRLVQIRGQSMQDAAEQRAGTMVSMLGIDESQALSLAEAVLADGVSEEDGLPPVLAPVNFNCPGQVVFSGSLKACERATELGERFGVSRAVPLKVAGAFHTDMMQPAAERLSQALNAVALQDLSCPVIANVIAQPYGSSREIPQRLIQQLTQPVRWQQSIEYLLDEGFDRFVEIGPGRVLTGLAKKVMRPRKSNAEIETVSA